VEEAAVDSGTQGLAASEVLDGVLGEWTWEPFVHARAGAAVKAMQRALLAAIN
jgi:hypothetical protein